MITPEPLITRRRVEVADSEARRQISTVAAVSSHGVRPRRRDPRWATAAALTRARPNSATSGAIAALVRTRSTEGRPRSAELLVAEPPLGIRSAYLSVHRRPTMLKQDDELDKLEEDIRKLKNKYDQFFSGIIKMPPTMERHNLEVYVHELGKQKMRENARRFRFNQLLSRYNQYREMWGRKMREREEGPLEFKRRQAALTQPADASSPPPRTPRVTS